MFHDTISDLKINSYAGSEFTERFCDFQDTSMARTNKPEVKAVMVNL